ncbi:hypothetical protein P3T76_004801 [Phytophthora citrophthora]|uniref:Uncharacterized protein n=1 Tax=Phytophthora citrophthora TaxID=4793 RepID=A0AAD9GRJ6_9STRA|nr:hypothetical protein P3T76_004801 [Phytophthora citrophthora]
MFMNDSPQIKSGNWGTGVLLTPESLGFYHKPTSFNEASNATSEPSTNAITRLLQTVTDDGSVAVLSAHYVVPEGNTCECMELPEEELGFEEGCSSTPAAGVIQFEYSDDSCYEMYFDDTEMYAECDYNGFSMGDAYPCYMDFTSDASSAESDESTTDNTHSESEIDGGTMSDEEDSATVTVMSYLAPAEGDCNCIDLSGGYTIMSDSCSYDLSWGQVLFEYSDSTCYTLEFNKRDLYADCDYTNQRSGDTQLCSLDLSEDTSSTTETPATRSPTTTPPDADTLPPPNRNDQGSDSKATNSSAQATQFSAGRLLAVITMALLLLH